MKDNLYLLAPTEPKGSASLNAFNQSLIDAPSINLSGLGRAGIKKDKRKNWQIYRDIQSVKYEREYKSLTNKQKKQ